MADEFFWNCMIIAPDVEILSHMLVNWKKNHLA